jgi:hypothetical protein
MDLLTHIFSGAAAATAVAAVAGGRPKRRLGMVVAGAFGGMAPDVDAISMWSRFDGTFGRLFGLEHTGREIYGSKLWYSHHAFFHSLAAAVLLALLFGLAAWALTRRGTLKAFFKQNYVFGVAFVAGYVAHLLGDLPTPASVWGGIAMYWPARAYVGGTGQIWWWNNYDIFLLVALCAAVNTVLLLTLKRHLKAVVGGICALALAVVLVQVHTRKYDYAYTGNASDYAQMEERSEQEQRRILGPRLYKAIRRLDEALPIHF